MSVYGPYLGVSRDNSDGDTAGIDIDAGFGIAITTRSVTTGRRLMTCRLYGINSPEMRIRDPLTLKLVDNPDGIAARDYLTSLIPAGTLLKVVSHLWDREGGRFDGELTRLSDGLDVNKAMVDAGHAVVYLP